jgi:hypothetical protein
MAKVKTSELLKELNQRIDKVQSSREFKELLEMEAEAVAFTVMNYFGVEIKSEKNQ